MKIDSRNADLFSGRIFVKLHKAIKQLLIFNPHKSNNGYLS